MKVRPMGLALGALIALALLPQPVCAVAAHTGGEALHSVGSALEFSQALADIEADDVNGATIELTSDIALDASFTGISGEKVTVRSAQGGTHLLSWPSGVEAVKLEGAITFEDVHVSPKTFYANGHHLTLGDGFGGGADGEGRMIVYGGSDADLTADTHLTITDGVYKLVAGGNSAGTLTGDTRVEFGGDARFPNAADGFDPDGGDADRMPEKTEHYNLYFNLKLEDNSPGPVIQLQTVEGYLPYGLYGGGIDGNVDGHTNITMTGGEVFQIFGGGAVRKSPSRAGTDLGKVSGSTTVDVTGGTVKSIYGGGFNAIDALDENNEATDADRDVRAAVSGDANVTVSGTAYIPEATRVQWDTTSGHDIPGVYGGSFHSSVQNTHVVIGGDARLETRVGDTGCGMVFAGGCNDKVRGTTYVELTGNARVGNDGNPEFTYGNAKGGIVTPLGRSNGSRCYLGGVAYGYGPVILNEGGAEYAGIAKVSGGQADVLMAAHKQAPNVDKKTTVKGSIQLAQTGGTLQAIEAGSKAKQSVVIEPKQDRSPVDVLISGGTTKRWISGRFVSSSLSNIDHAELTFDPCGNETSYVEVPNMLCFDSITVRADAHVAAKPEHADYAIKKTAFTKVGDLTIEQSGHLALRDNASISGDLALDGALHLVKAGILAPRPRTLTAAGTATGTGELRIIAKPADGTDYSQFKTPKSGEECVYATAEGSDMALGLANREQQLFVDRKNKRDAQDVWFINERAPQMVTVTFDKNGGDTEAVPGSMTVASASTVGELPAEPTRAGHTFLGWNTKADGSGDAFAADTPVTGDITVYAQWREVPEQLWYYELYYQSFTPDGNQIDKSGLRYSWIKQAHGQGGWAHPGDAVSISSKKFDGKQFAWDANDGSGKETLGVHYVFDESYGPHRLNATCGEATKDNPLKIYYRATPHTVSYEYEGEVPDGAPQPPATTEAAYGATVTIAGEPSIEGWEFSGWSIKTPAGASIADDGTLIMPNADIVLTAQWQKDEPVTPPVDPGPDPEQPGPGPETPEQPEPEKPDHEQPGKPEPAPEQNPADGEGAPGLPATGDPSCAAMLASGALTVVSLGAGVAARKRAKE